MSADKFDSFRQNLDDAFKQARLETGNDDFPDLPEDLLHSLARRIMPTTVSGNDARAWNGLETLPPRFLIVEVKYEDGTVDQSWNESLDPSAGAEGFDSNHGRAVGWRKLAEGDTPNPETYNMLQETLARYRKSAPKKGF